MKKVKKDKKVQIGVRIPKKLMISWNYLLDKSPGMTKNLVLETALDNFFNLSHEEQIKRIKEYLWQSVSEADQTK